MATKARLHWFWRGAIAAGVAATASWVWIRLSWTSSDYVWLGGLFAHLIHLGVPTHIGERGIWITGTVTYYIVPAVVVALGVCGWLSGPGRSGDRDGELHCRGCDHILRGLSEPRCPECGEPI